MGVKKNTKSPVAKRLKEARLRQKFSQKGLGIKVGFDQFVASARMNQYETGKHVPDYGTVKRIARVLKIPVTYFYCDDNELAKLILAWSQLSKTKKKQILKSAKA